MLVWYLVVKLYTNLHVVRCVVVESTCGVVCGGGIYNVDSTWCVVCGGGIYMWCGVWW